MTKYDFENSVGFIVNNTAKAFQKALDAELRKNVGVTISQWRVISTLVRQSGLTQKEIADKVGIEGSTLVPIIDKMEENGLVERKSDSKDRRINRIFLTKKSEATVDSITDVALELRKIIYKGLSQEKLESVNAVLRTIINNSSKAIDDSK